jgi:hypothetical protein
VENLQQKFTITNPNQCDMTLRNAEVTGDPAFALVNDECRGKTLAPEESCTITIEFDPGLGSVSATLAVPDTDGQSASIPLTGAGILKVSVTIDGIAGPGHPYGTVQDDHGMLACPPTCTVVITDPQQPTLTLTATPNNNGQSSNFTYFDYWSGDCSGKTCTLDPVNLQQDAAVTAFFNTAPG